MAVTEGSTGSRWQHRRPASARRSPPALPPACLSSDPPVPQGACVDGDTTMMVTELMDTDLYRALQVQYRPRLRACLPACLCAQQAAPELRAPGQHVSLESRASALALLLIDSHSHPALAAPPVLLQSKRVSWYRHGMDIAIDVAQALHFLHCRNIIHFDCKSPNILLSTTNQAKLAGE